MMKDISARKSQKFSRRGRGRGRGGRGRGRGGHRVNMSFSIVEFKRFCEREFLCLILMLISANFT